MIVVHNKPVVVEGKETVSGTLILETAEVQLVQSEQNLLLVTKSSPARSDWVVTACWDGKNRRVRFRCKSIENARYWLEWVQRNEPNTDPWIELGRNCDVD
jgi:hypothetical protein